MELNPEIITKNGKPIKVILDIDKYEELLELVEDREDLKQVRKAKKNGLKFQKLSDFLKEYKPRV